MCQRKVPVGPLARGEEEVPVGQDEGLHHGGQLRQADRVVLRNDEDDDSDDDDNDDDDDDVDGPRSHSDVLNLKSLSKMNHMPTTII